MLPFTKSAILKAFVSIACLCFTLVSPRSSSAGLPDAVQPITGELACEIAAFEANNSPNTLMALG